MEHGCSLLQGICLTQGLNPGLPQCRQTLYRLSHEGSSFRAQLKQNLFCSIWVAVTTYHRLAGWRLTGPRSSSQPTFWFIDGPLLLVSLGRRRGEGALWSLFYKDKNPIHEGSTLCLNHHPKVSTPTYQHIRGNQFQHFEGLSNIFLGGLPQESY